MEATNPDADASEAGRALVGHRWGNRAVLRAASMVINRAAELPPEVRAEVHTATQEAEHE
jgi:hypothetical protein